jgi:hypothetical protein
MEIPHDDHVPLNQSEKPGRVPPIFFFENQEPVRPYNVKTFFWHWPPGSTTKGPKRSWLGSSWSAFIDWAPVRAARSFLGHVALGLVCMGGIWLSEEAFHWLFPTEPKFFDWISGQMVLSCGGGRHPNDVRDLGHI